MTPSLRDARSPCVSPRRRRAVAVRRETRTVGACVAAREIIMKTNMGDIDRIVRMIAGAALLLLFFFGPKTYWGLLGLIPLSTALIGYCPLYKVFGVSTYPYDEKRA
jgi:hypothetical protein